MSLQNRVDPLGNIHAVFQRGTWMANRGILHDAHKKLVRYHQLSKNRQVWMQMNIRIHRNFLLDR